MITLFHTQERLGRLCVWRERCSHVILRGAARRVDAPLERASPVAAHADERKRPIGRVAAQQPQRQVSEAAACTPGAATVLDDSARPDRTGRPRAHDWSRRAQAAASAKVVAPGDDWLLKRVDRLGAKLHLGRNLSPVDGDTDVRSDLHSNAPTE